MNFPRVQSEMQEDRLWSLCPVHDIGEENTLSLLCCDLYLRQLKETLKQTMLEQESVFEDQIHELHRLYQRQKDLMMEMEETNNSYGQLLNTGVSSPRKSVHWMGSSISPSKTSVLPTEDASNQIEEAVFSGDESDKSGEKVLDLELPSYGYLDMGEEEGLKNGEVLDFLKDQSPRRMSCLTDLSSFKCILDLNEPAKIEEHSSYKLNQFLSPAQTRSEKAEPEAQDTSKSTKSQAENGIDLNMSPLASQEGRTIFKSEQSREFFSASLHGKHGSGPSRVIVQALPCLKSIPLFQNRCKSSTRRPWSRKKGKRGAKSTKPREASNLDSNVGVNEDENNSLSIIASHIPESDQNQEHLEEVSLISSLPKLVSARNWTNTGKRRRLESGKVMRKIARTKSKTRGSFLVTEEEENQEKSAAAEAIVDMSLSDSAGKSSVETSDCITPLRWFAKIASSVVEDSKSEVGLSVTGFHSDYDVDYFEAMTLQMKPEEQLTNTPVSNIVPAKHKRTPRSQGRRQQQQHRDCENEFLLSTFTGNEASQDLNKIERIIEASETNDVMKNMVVIDWGTIRKRRRGNRIPAANTNTSIAVWRNQSFLS